MNILGVLLIGLLIGALAKAFHPGKDPGGIIVTMLLGVAGSLLAGFFGREILRARLLCQPANATPDIDLPGKVGVSAENWPEATVNVAGSLRTKFSALLIRTV